MQIHEAESPATPSECSSDRQLETILQTVPDAFIRLSCEGHINGWNAGAEKIYQWPASEAIGMPAEVLTPEEDRAEFSRLFREWLTSDKDLIFETPWKYRARRRNGEVFVAQLTAARLRGPNPGLAFLVRDLTEHRALQEKLLRSEQRYRAILDNIEEGCFEVDASGKFTFMNDSFAAMFGYTPEEMVGLSYKVFYHPDEVPKIRAAFNTVWRTGVPLKSLEYLIACKDGSNRFVEDSVSLKKDRKGAPAGFFGIRRDITSRKVSEVALRTSEAKWRDLFERASDLVYSTDAYGRLTGINCVGEQITGYSRDELVGRPVRSFVAPESIAAYDQIRTEIVAGKTGCVHDIEIVTKRGQRIPLELSVSPLSDKERRVGVVGIARDMTGRRRADRFEQGRAAILEGIARDVPLDDLLRGIATLVDRELPESGCAVVLREAGLERVVRALPETDSSPAGIPGSPNDSWSFPVPVASRQRVVHLAITQPPRPRPDPEEQNFLGKIAELVAIAIDHRCFTDQLAHQARHDALTGLPNRVFFEDRIRQMIVNAETEGGDGALIWLDLDEFKHVNDTFGHRIGDLLLAEVSRRLLARVGGMDTLARLGGDEFAVIVPGTNAAQHGTLLAESFLAALRVPFRVSGHELRVTASMGICVYPRDGRDANTLLRNADRAMYSAKSRCRGQYRFFTPEMGQGEAERLDIETQLRIALDCGGLEVFYQPQFTVARELAGLEALVRFRHPTLGYIPPERFIPIAEESGMIEDLGSWVLREVCRQGVEWERRGCRTVRLAVNVSAIQFAQEGFAAQVRELLAETGMPATRLELELTETVIMNNPEAAIREMRQLRALGVSIAIDDFGTGYSSLNYLHRLEVDRLKIDRSFVLDLNAKVTTLPVVQSIMALARTFGTEVIAEGVETELQLRTLKDMGCDLVQGYYFSRPIPANDIQDLFLSSAAIPKRVPLHSMGRSRPKGIDIGQGLVA